jgi:glycosyltransferase involved in cell wall biosynthesis
MHIGFVSRIQPANFLAHLDASAIEAARGVKGHLNSSLLNLIPELLRRNHQISVFSAAPGLPAPLVLKGPNLTFHLVPLRGKKSGAEFDGFRRERRLLVQAIRENPPALVHAHWTHDGHASAALDSGLPALVTENGMRLHTLRMSGNLRPSTLPQALASLLMTWSVCRRARHLSAVSPATAEHLRRYFFCRQPIAILPNAFPFDTWRPLLQAPRHPFDPARPVFTDIARWGELKNVTTLLAAFARVREQIPGAQLVLFGNGLGPAGAAEKWAAPRRLTPGVTFRGPLPYAELMREMGETSDFLVHLSRIETFCNTVCEALAFDRPVIAGDVGGISWAAEALPVTYLKNVLDAGAAAGAMLRLAQTHNPAEPRGWAAILERRYAPAVIADLSERRYEEVLRHP